MSFTDTILPVHTNKGQYETRENESLKWHANYASRCVFLNIYIPQLLISVIYIVHWLTLSTY